MMNDIAVSNISNILRTEIGNGHNVIGIISVDEDGSIHLCWRTKDPKIAKQWEDILVADVKLGIESRQTVPICKEA